jgi:hypothetical protein
MAEIAEFPFVGELPKREKSRLARLWEAVREVTAAQEEHGPVLNQLTVAMILGVSRQRVCQLIDAGSLQSIAVTGNRLVTLRSLEDYCKTDRKTGHHLPEKFDYKNAMALCGRNPNWTKKSS